MKERLRELLSPSPRRWSKLRGTIRRNYGEAGKCTNEGFVCGLCFGSRCMTCGVNVWGNQFMELWGLSTENTVVSNYTIGIDEIEVMVRKMAEFGDWPVYKIKLGTPHDLEIVEQLRKHTDAIFPSGC